MGPTVRAWGRLLRTCGRRGERITLGRGRQGREGRFTGRRGVMGEKRRKERETAGVTAEDAEGRGEKRNGPHPRPLSHGRRESGRRSWVVDGRRMGMAPLGQRPSVSVLCPFGGPIALGDCALGTSAAGNRRVACLCRLAHYLGPLTSERQPRVLLRCLLTKNAMAITKKTVPTATIIPGAIGRSFHTALDAACALAAPNWRGGFCVAGH